MLKLLALRAGRIYPPGRFVVFISVLGWVDPRAVMRLEGLRKLKKKINFIGVQTCDLPACSVVPQQTTLPRAPCFQNLFEKREERQLSRPQKCLIWDSNRFTPNSSMKWGSVRVNYSYFAIGTRVCLPYMDGYAAITKLLPSISNIRYF
jgi:hypothetical protein